MSVPFKVSPSKDNQHALFPSNIFTLLPDDHKCNLYKSLFEQLNTSTLEKSYSHIGPGQSHIN